MNGEAPREVISLDERRRRKHGASGFSPFLAFDSDDPEFVRGYEAGILSVRLEAAPDHWGGTYHATNQEMICRIAAAYGYEVKIEDSGDPTWVFAEFCR